MKQTILILHLLIFFVCTGLAQSVSDLASVSIYSKDSLQMFDSHIIKERKIKRAFLMHIRKVNRSPWFVNDTCFVYEFNDAGVAFRRIDYNISRADSSTWTDTLSLPQVHERFQEYYPDTMITKTAMLSTGKMITQYIFNEYAGRLDTSIIIRTKYNRQNQKLEEEIIPTKLYFKLIDCVNDQPPYHYKYGYDNKGRLTYYRDYSTKEYLQISYPSYGELIQHFDVKSNQLLTESVNTITLKTAENWLSVTRTITTDNVRMIISHREMRNSLIQSVTILQTSFPGVESFVFDYK